MFERLNQNWKKRKRRREVDSRIIDEIKESFCYDDKEISQLLKISTSQLSNYRACGRAPADRIMAMKIALDIAIEDEARSKRELLNKIMFKVIA